MNHNSLSHQTWPIDRCFHTGNDFHKSFERFGGLGIQILFNLATCSSYSRINYVKMPVFQFLEKVNNYQLLKMAKSLNMAILIKTLKCLELLSSLQHWAKNMFEVSFWLYVGFKRKKPPLCVSFMMWQCLWWCHRFWNLWILHKHNNPDISRRKLFFQRKKIP